MRLIIRWRCGDTSDTQADNCALLVFLLPFYCQIVSSSKRRLETLAMLLTKGFGALYIGAVYAVVFDKSSSFSSFAENYSQVAFIRSMPRL